MSCPLNPLLKRSSKRDWQPKTRRVNRKDFGQCSTLFQPITTQPESWLVRQNVRRSWRLQGNSTWYKSPQFSSTIFAHYSEKVPWPCKKNEFCQFFSSFFATMFTTSSTIPNVRRNDFSLLTNRQIWISTVGESSLTVRSQKSSPQEFVLVGWKQEQGICLTLYFLGSSGQLVSVK